MLNESFKNWELSLTKQLMIFISVMSFFDCKCFLSIFSLRFIPYRLFLLARLSTDSHSKSTRRSWVLQITVIAPITCNYCHRISYDNQITDGCSVRHGVYSTRWRWSAFVAYEISVLEISYLIRRLDQMLVWSANLFDQIFFL